MLKLAKFTKNEKARIERLKKLRVLDSVSERLFDEITKLASDICGTPIALITLVDEKRQWFKANTGLEGITETHRDLAFCAHAILEDKIFEVEDATKDSRFKNNPLVTADPNICFYAGMPLMLPDGYNVGTLCVIDTKPKKLSDSQRQALSGLSAIVTQALLLTEQDIYEVGRKNDILAAIIESSEDAIISKKTDGTVTSWNAAAEKMFGYISKEMVGDSVAKLFPLDKTHEESELIKKLKLNQDVKHYETERMTKNNGRIHVSVSLSPIKNANGEMIGASKIIRDITEVKSLRKAVELQNDVSDQRIMAKEITYHATHDSLTGLINRSEFESLLKQYTKKYRQADTLGALMYIDLDQFKIVNYSCGHAAGDKLLKLISSIIKSCLRDSDSLARIGGDEFAIILSECNPDKALSIANAVCDSVNKYRFSFNNQRFHIGASIGVVIIDSQWPSATSLLQAADFACYEAKNAGRNRVHLHHNEDGVLERNRDEMHWANCLEAALEENRLEVFAQRIMPLEDGELERAEVLLRLRSESGELVSPDRFLPSAERFNMMGRIDRWMVRQALSWVGDNISQLAHIGNISINLSGQSLNDKAFHHFVTNLIDQVEFDPAKICFEITETIAINNIADAIAFIESLKQYGVQFSLDDFGSGVSSFGYLKTLPVDCLKIDGQFIKDLADNEIGQATVKCIAEVAKITHKKTIAEYVGSDLVEGILKEMGIDFTQGFYRHKPAPIRYLLEKRCSYSPTH